MAILFLFKKEYTHIILITIWIFKSGCDRNGNVARILLKCNLLFIDTIFFFVSLIVENIALTCGRWKNTIWINILIYLYETDCWSYGMFVLNQFCHNKFFNEYFSVIPIYVRRHSIKHSSGYVRQFSATVFFVLKLEFCYNFFLVLFCFFFVNFYNWVIRWDSNIIFVLHFSCVFF